jgi:hypothetical protein
MDKVQKPSNSDFEFCRQKQTIILIYSDLLGILCVWKWTLLLMFRMHLLTPFFRTEVGPEYGDSMFHRHFGGTAHVRTVQILKIRYSTNNESPRKPKIINVNIRCYSLPPGLYFRLLQ